MRDPENHSSCSEEGSPCEKKKKNLTAFTKEQIVLRMFIESRYHEICIDDCFSFLKL